MHIMHTRTSAWINRACRAWHILVRKVLLSKIDGFGMPSQAGLLRISKQRVRLHVCGELAVSAAEHEHAAPAFTMRGRQWLQLPPVAVPLERAITPAVEEAMPELAAAEVAGVLRHKPCCRHGRLTGVNPSILKISNGPHPGHGVAVWTDCRPQPSPPAGGFSRQPPAMQPCWWTRGTCGYRVVYGTTGLAGNEDGLRVPARGMN